MTFEQVLEAKARKYIAALQARGVFTTLERAMDEIDRAHKNAGKPVCGDFYLREDTLLAILEDAYKAPCNPPSAS